jgi:hypothetical protein
MEKRARLPHGGRDAHFCMPRTLHAPRSHSPVRTPRRWPTRRAASARSPRRDRSCRHRKVRRRSGSTASTARINQHPQRSGGRARDRAQPRCPMSTSSSDTASVRWRAPEWRTRRPDRSAQFREHGMACRRGATSRSRASEASHDHPRLESALAGVLDIAPAYLRGEARMPDFPGLSVRVWAYSTNVCSTFFRHPPQPRPANLMRPAAVVKLVYTRRSGRRALTGVEVRVLSAASES